jgi:hypothetical protein
MVHLDYQDFLDKWVMLVFRASQALVVHQEYQVVMDILVYEEKKVYQAYQEKWDDKDFLDYKEWKETLDHRDVQV